MRPRQKDKEALEKTQAFSEWMLKIKNVHYANNAKMASAYEKVYKHNLKES